MHELLLSGERIELPLGLEGGMWTDDAGGEHVRLNRIDKKHIYAVNNEKKWKTVLRRLAYLRAEIVEVQSTHNEVETELTNRIEKREKVRRAKESQKTETTSDKKEIVTYKTETASQKTQNAKEELLALPETKDEGVPDHYKKLWRIIAKETHPDVAGNDPELTMSYKTAAEAYRAGLTEILLDVAADINVKVTDPEPELIVDAAKRCDYYAKKIESLRGSNIWSWGTATAEAKEAALEILLKIREGREKNKKSR
jgi:seryl-tRNA synthetase